MVYLDSKTKSRYSAKSNEVTNVITNLIDKRNISLNKLGLENDTTRQNITQKLERQTFDYYVESLNTLVQSLGCDFSIEIKDKETKEVYYKR